MTSASKGTSVKKAPAARPAAAPKQGAGTTNSSSKAGTTVPKRTDGKSETKKDANREVTKAAPASKRAVPANEKASTARKAATASNTAKGASGSAKKAAAPGSKKTAPEKAAASPSAAKKAASKTAAAPKAAAAPTAKKAASRSAKTDTASSDAPASPVSSAAANGAAPARTTFTPKPKPPAPVRPKTGPYAKDTKFLEEMRELLQGERAIYQEQATSLRAEADSLALEREPGDVQFDEESGEGGTVTVDRERNLALSGQATIAVEEIDAAQARIDDKTYGYCERCFQPIPKPRLRALPYARLCVACKSGGLSRR